MGTCALLAALETLLCFSLYIWSLFWLRRRMLVDQRELSRAELARLAPGLAWLPVLHSILAPIIVVLALCTGFLVGLESVPPLSYGVGSLVAVGLLSLCNSLVELLSGVCPIYGVLIKRQSRQRFILAPEVRRLGVARLGISMLVLALAALLRLL